MPKFWGPRTARLAKLASGFVLNVVTGLARSFSGLRLFNAIRSKFAPLTSAEASSIFQFWKAARDAGASFGRLNPNVRQSPRRIPLSVGVPEFGVGLSQYVYKVSIKYDHPTFGQPQYITAFVDNDEPLTPNELSLDVHNVAKQEIPGYLFSLNPQLQVSDLDLTVEIQWVMRRF